MPTIKISLRLQPSQVYEIQKISRYFNTTPSVVIRNSIDDYIEIFKTWRGRIVLHSELPEIKSEVEYHLNKIEKDESP